MSQSIIHVILTGGVGSRLWPLSRKSQPKQYLELFEGKSLFEMTVARNSHLVNQVMVVGNVDNCHLSRKVLEKKQTSYIDIVEAIPRNTAAAIAFAAFAAQSEDILIVTPSDHIIDEMEAYTSAITEAIAKAQDNYIVTFGIVPTKPETGYGYIKRGSCKKLNDAEAYQVAQFVEKPKLETALEYLSSGDYYWNSGMFLFKASSLLAELQQFAPEIVSAAEAALKKATCDLDFIRLDNAAFSASPSDSIDYAVMEKSANAAMVALDAGWSDVGSWSSLWDISDKNGQDNVHKGDVLSCDSSGNYVFAETGLVATVGLQNVVVVQTKDAVLVATKDRVQDVKSIVQQLKDLGRSEHKIHREVYRPWGKYDSIDQGQRYQVKHITVHPGQKLSVQMHHHRAEHWIVVAGTALVSIDGVDTLLSENQSVYIPLGAVHALENPGKIPLELIEVQSGTYLGEDDIVRFSDRYGRVDAK